MPVSLSSHTTRHDDRWPEQGRGYGALHRRTVAFVTSCALTATLAIATTGQSSASMVTAGPAPTWSARASATDAAAAATTTIPGATTTTIPGTSVPTTITSL